MPSTSIHSPILVGRLNLVEPEHKMYSTYVHTYNTKFSCVWMKKCFLLQFYTHRTSGLSLIQRLIKEFMVNALYSVKRGPVNRTGVKNLYSSYPQYHRRADTS